MLKCCLKKKCGKVPVSAIFVGIIALWLIWFGSASVLTQELVESNLRQMSDKLVAVGKKHGREVKLNYGAVEITGWAYNKSAVIKSVSLEVGEPNFPARKYSFVVGDLTVEADAFGMDRIVVSAKSPINIVRGGTVVGVVKHSMPFRYVYSNVQKAGKETFYYDFLLPKEVKIVGVVGDEQEKDADALTISLGDYAPIHWSATPSEMANSMSYNFSGLNISSNKFSLSIDNILGSLESGLGASAATISGQYNVALANIVYSQEGKTSKQYSVSMDMAFNNDLPVDAASPSPSALSAEKPKDSKEELIINNAMISSPDFSINSSGSVTTANSDPLPYGNIDIKIDNLPQFLNSELIPEQLRGAVTSVLEKAAGQPLAGQTTLDIPVKRETNNVLFVGKSTFEQLAGAFVAGSLTGGSPVPSNQLTPDNGGFAVPPVSLPMQVPSSAPPVDESGVSQGSEGSQGMTGSGGGVSGSVGGSDGQPPVVQP